MIGQSRAGTATPPQNADGIEAGPAPQSILNALTSPLFVVDGENCFSYANLAAEQFFAASVTVLRQRRLDDLLRADSPLFDLLERVRSRGHSITEYGLVLESPKVGSHRVSVNGVPLLDTPGSVVLSFDLTSIAERIENQLTHRGAARSVTGMAAVLAHEIKNPLSGIRGAAQLLQRDAAPGEMDLTRLICQEADRIVALVDHMEVFADERPLERAAVNIHEILEYVRKLAQSGFARNHRFEEDYDPSLPLVHGNRDLLIQAVLNLVKNAAESAPAEGGEIALSTRYRQGLRLALPGTKARVELPLVISVRDNGPGIPEELQRNLFDPFVSTKYSGKGLGLAVVAKAIGDHGGVVEFESAPRRTIFRLALPMAPADAATVS